VSDCVRPTTEGQAEEEESLKTSLSIWGFTSLCKFGLMDSENSLLLQAHHRPEVLGLVASLPHQKYKETGNLNII